MRFLTAILLLLTLPGLLVPGGFTWHWCRCATAATGGEREASCCTNADEPAPPSCCQCECGGAPRDDGTDQPTHRDSRCKCTILQAPEHKPVPAPPDRVDPLVLAAAPASSASLPLFVEIRFATRWHTASCRPPPPGLGRNLPLLL